MLTVTDQTGVYDRETAVTDSIYLYVYNADAFYLVDGEGNNISSNNLVVSNEEMAEDLPTDTDAILALREQLRLQEEVSINYEGYDWDSIRDTIQLEVDEEASVYGDPVKLARVFNNILKNAVTYSYPGTAIQIRTEETQTNIRIFFQNKGKTIPEHRLETIFDKFFRLDDARVSATGGAGLGLAIAKEIIESHKGTVTAHSEDEQTTFCVTLPAAKAVT